MKALIESYLSEKINFSEAQLHESKYRNIERAIDSVRSDISSALRKTSDYDETMKLEFADRLLGDAADAIRFIR